MFFGIDAAEHFWNNLSSDEVVSVESMWEEISRALENFEVQGFILNTYINLQDTYDDAEEFEGFFTSFPHLFFVENGWISQYDAELEDGRTGAVEYFEEILQNYIKAPHYMNFRGHIGQAESYVIYFINTFYPGEDFKYFLQSYPNAFVVFQDDTVSLTATLLDETVDYFAEILQYYGDQHHTSLRGHIGQAPTHIQEFINTRYPGDDFVDFLTNNDHVFDIDDDGEVCLL